MFYVYAYLTTLDPSELGLDIRWIDVTSANDIYIIYLLPFRLLLPFFINTFLDCLYDLDHVLHHLINISVCNIIRRSNKLAQLTISDGDRRSTRLNFGHTDPRAADPHLVASPETPSTHAERGRPAGKERELELLEPVDDGVYAS